MDYEKAYKEALERAKYLKENTNSVNAKDISYTFEYIFPELRESEDERIRKEIIAYLNVQESLVQSKDDVFKEWIAWLEKQKRNKTIKFSEEDEKTRLWIIHVLCECGLFDKHVCVMDYYTFPFLDTEVNEGDYYIKLEDLKTLPKEE